MSFLAESASMEMLLDLISITVLDGVPTPGF